MHDFSDIHLRVNSRSIAFLRRSRTEWTVRKNVNVGSSSVEAALPFCSEYPDFWLQRQRRAQSSPQLLFDDDGRVTSSPRALFSPPPPPLTSSPCSSVEHLRCGGSGKSFPNPIPPALLVPLDPPSSYSVH